MLSDNEVWKQTIQKMKEESKSSFVISVFDKMLKALNNSDPEVTETPRYLSIIEFGYNIFDLSVHEYRMALEWEKNGRIQ